MARAIKLEGFDELIADLNTKAERIRKEAEPIVGRTGEDVAAAMRNEIRRLSGETADSVTVDTVRTTAGGDVKTEVGPTHFVARFLESGTVKMPPYSFVEQSLQPKVDPFERSLADIAADF